MKFPHIEISIEQIGFSWIPYLTDTAMITPRKIHGNISKLKQLLCKKNLTYLNKVFFFLFEKAINSKKLVNLVNVMQLITLQTQITNELQTSKLQIDVSLIL